MGKDELGGCGKINFVSRRSVPSIQQKIQWLLEDLKGYQPEKIILFGSAARREADSFSDLDVLIIKHTRTLFVQRAVEAVKFLRPEIAPVDFFVYTPDEFNRMVEEESPFIERILAEGKVLYEKAA
ncbi:MAG: nucleotidyltransferase domain-containing protein [Candidatus Omnitrophica bacterium]|nr:nucleotidyltransferase domain-containing protein [Candidatus Omnitrophota bacterium]